MADSISGKFDYNTLVRTLKQNGVETKDMSAALRKVANDNDISNIREIDKSEKITIDKSIFTNTDTANLDPTSSNFFAANQDMVLAPVIMGGNGEQEQLPEIFNEEDYEVVDYDDFYNFNSEEPVAKTMEWRLDRDGYGDVEARTMEWRLDRDGYGQAEAILLDAKVTDFATNPLNTEKMPEFLQDNPAALLSSAGFSFTEQYDKNYSTDVDKDREDLLEGAMQMEMNMSNDAFNA